MLSGKQRIFGIFVTVFFFPHISCQRQSYCITADISLYFVERRTLCSYQTVRSTRPCSVPLAYPFTLVQLANSAPLILLPEANRHQRIIPPLATSETFTQRRMRRIGAGSLHSKGSVNGATVTGLWFGFVVCDGLNPLPKAPCVSSVP